jgi:hypothetical protein
MTAVREKKGFAGRNRSAELDFTFADFALMAATNGLAATLNIGSVLPPDAVVDGHSVLVSAYFTGGGATTVTLQVGAAGILGDIGAGHNLLSTTTLNKWLQLATPGVQAVGPAYGGLQLIATITPDVGHQMKLLTAGAGKIRVYYFVPDSSI